MIALVDYGLGNLRSVEKALAAAGAQVKMTDKAADILAADKVVLPGVGAFGDGMAGLRARGLVEVLKTVAARGVPLLGICLGMQLLFEASEEGEAIEQGKPAGLSLLPGQVRRFPEMGLKIPQTGWNQLIFGEDISLLHGLENGCYAYFNHSYYCIPASQGGNILAYTEYGLKYASMVGHGNLYGVQFHPEKSQSVGLKILRNFLRI